MFILTARQSEILDFVKDYLVERGMPPTIEEIRVAIGVRSANGVREHLRALERKGALELVSGVSRGIRLVENPFENQLEAQSESCYLPIIGRVAAGSPILAEPNVEDRCQLETTLFTQQPDYLLRVVGTSMIDIGILEGDLLAIHKTREARNGQIVIARIDDEVTVKRFKKEGSKAYLIAENPDFKPIELDLRRDPLTIEGVVVGMVREI